jgi:type II secretory pathway pseudopilin PulG
VDTASKELDELMEPEVLDVEEPGASQASEDAERRKEEGAAGLIEIAAVILVVAILTIGGLFLFGAFSGGSQDSVAQQNATNSLTDARAALATNSGYYPGAGALSSALSSAEPNVSYFTGTTLAANPGNVSLAVNTGSNNENDQLVLAAFSGTDGKCFWIVDNLDGAAPTLGNATMGTNYATTTPGSAGCTASSPPATYSKGTWT